MMLKFDMMLYEESDEVIVPMIEWTTQPFIGKDLYFNNANVRG